MLSLIPGVSRSGIVITAGRFLNFDRFESSKISFYLSIPAIVNTSPACGNVSNASATNVVPV